ncbi:MAG: outer membrane beta-barrel domain-containing protein [Bdellovibrionia bacterium]
MNSAKLAILTLLFSTTAWAQSGGDKMDIQNLEKKYWAAKDDDFAVVQNRRFEKANRFFLNVSTGPLINDPFATGYITSFQGGYFLNERWGFDVALSTGDLKNNNTVDEFINQNGFAPKYAIFQSSTIASVNYVPLYAKMSFLDKSIIYFDMGVSAGLGTLDYEIQTAVKKEKKSTFVYSFGIHQQIFFTEKFAVKLEVLNKFSDQKQKKFSDGSDQGTKNINDTTITLGLTYWH